VPFLCFLRPSAIPAKEALSADENKRKTAPFSMPPVGPRGRVPSQCVRGQMPLKLKAS